MIELKDVSRNYQIIGRNICALNQVNLFLPKGSFTAIRGESGSGKSTLLNLLGLMDHPSTGQYFLNGQPTERLNDMQKSALRAKTLGFLFQSFRLISSRTILENILLPMDIAGKSKDKKIWKERAMLLLEQVGLADRAEHIPAELSGGQMQRAAFARALAAEPQVLLADEPTGNLDPENRDLILKLISQFHDDGNTVVVVTHDPLVAVKASNQIFLHQGSIIDSTFSQQLELKIAH